MAVFKRGTWKGLKIRIPIGGQVLPSSIEGDRLLWKKAQKNLIKKKISETINKIIPQRNPMVTKAVCNPWKVPSREMSRHHWYIVRAVIRFPKMNKDLLYWWNSLINPETIVKAPMAPIRGQGL